MDTTIKDKVELEKAPDTINVEKLHCFAVEYAFINEQLHNTERSMLEFILKFLKIYGQVSLGLTEEEELDDSNFPVTTALYGKYDTPCIKITNVYLTDGKYLYADGIDVDTRKKRFGFYIHSEQYADIFQFVGQVSNMN